MVRLGRGHLPLALETFAAKYWTSLGWPEGDSGVFAALRTSGSSFDLGGPCPDAGAAPSTDTRFILQALQRLGSFLNCLS